MINVYSNLGHGVMIIGAWAKDAFTVSVVLYLIVQSATNDWVCLVHTTGGLLKPQKCFWYMLSWIWKKGKARLKTFYELPESPLYVP
jgi:hypothetical protein